MELQAVAVRRESHVREAAGPGAVSFRPEARTGGERLPGAAFLVLSVVDVVELTGQSTGNVTPWSFRQLRYAAGPRSINHPSSSRILRAQARARGGSLRNAGELKLPPAGESACREAARRASSEPTELHTMLLHARLERREGIPLVC